MLIGKGQNQVPANCMLGSAAYINKEELPASTDVNNRLTTLEGNVPLTSSISVTVGTDGTYPTINAALEYLTKRFPLYKAGGITATIQLRSGFVMREQVAVKGLNLGWITISSVDSEVTIDHTFLTATYGDGVYPAFSGIGGAVLPLINALFTFGVANYGTLTGTKRVFLHLVGSRATIQSSKGVKYAPSVGCYIVRDSVLSASSSVITHSGTDNVKVLLGSTVTFDAATVTYALGTNLWAEAISDISFNGGTGTNAGTRGIFADASSRINANGANVRRNGTSDQATDAVIVNGSFISANGMLGGTSVTINTLSQNGVIFKV